VLNKLFKLTRSSRAPSACNMLALVDGEPRTADTEAGLQLYRRAPARGGAPAHRVRPGARARRRAHILQGLLIALDHLDAVIQTIRELPHGRRPPATNLMS
jgi:DNA gyrase subunit A